MKVRYRTCDICGKQMDGRDFQFWLRRPVIKCGAPSIGMKRIDVCNACFSKIEVYIQHPELLEPKEGT